MVNYMGAKIYYLNVISIKSDLALFAEEIIEDFVQEQIYLDCLWDEDELFEYAEACVNKAGLKGWKRDHVFKTIEYIGRL